MEQVWAIFGKFEFLGRLMGATVGGVTFYSAYIHLLFAGFWAWLAWTAASRPRRLAEIFRTPAPWVALAAGALFWLLSPHDLNHAYTYEIKNLSDASAAAANGGIAALLRQDRVVPLFFAVILKASNLEILTGLLCLFIGLFYAVWERILSDLGFGRWASAALALLAAWLQVSVRYLFSAYFIFALFFSALFLRQALLLVKGREKDWPLAELAKPLALILLAALFRQESLVLFGVYAAALLFLSRPAAKKGALALAAAGVLYLPFLWHDWTREEHQVLRPRWVQEHVDLLYDTPGGQIPRELFYENQLLANAAYTIRRGPMDKRLSRQEFSDAVKEVLFIPQPSFRNVWPNLKYRSGPFLAATFGWACFLIAALALRRRLAAELAPLSVLAAYILGFFLLFHSANLSIEIWVSHCHLLVAYLVFCAVVARRLYTAEAGT